MKLYLASDHAGVKLKEELKQYIDFTDLSPTYDPKDDYPDIAETLARKITKNSRGILICNSGIGMSIAANKIKGIRAFTARSKKDAFLARKDNDANLLCLGQSSTKPIKALHIIDAFLKTEFEGDKPKGKRHKRRVDKITKLET